MGFSNASYRKLADLTLFLKTQNGEDLMMSDMPRIIPLRWQYFKDNWEFFRPTIEARIPAYTEPNYLDQQIKDMTDFIESQRSSTKKVNPFSSEDILFRFYGVFDNVLINSIELTTKENNIVEEEIRRVARFNRSDFLSIREVLQDNRDTSFDQIGLSDPDYNTVMHRSSVPEQLNPTITELQKMQKIQDAIKSVDFILANLFSLDNSFVDPFALARANANNPEIEIASYSSGRLVRMNYGEDLQLLARRYLGDSDKWIDIAIANGLKPPYLDEVGRKLFLISNGDGSKINIAKTDTDGSLNSDRLFINQVILLQSDTENYPEQRVITNIREVPVSGEIIIELDGKDDLSRYKIAENAYMRVFKPNTINSSFFILIPSQQPLPDDREDKVPFFLEGAREDEKRAKVDLAINDAGDILFTATSDLQLSYGLANAVQAIKIKMSTKVGELRKHSDFGLVDIVGNTNVDVGQIRTLLSESINEQIALDPRFDRVDSIDIRYGVPVGNQGATVYFIQLSVRLAGGSRVIPISFTVAI